MNNNPIGVLDSGVGGLSVLSEIFNLLPNENLIYVADQAYMPYGVKSSSELISRVEKIIRFLIGKNVKAVIIACNTATVYTVSEMRQRFAFPILGVVPVVKTIAGKSKTGKIAVFSTPATNKSKYLDELILQFASDKTVFRVGESHLEDLIELGQVDSPEVNRILVKELKPLLKNHVDAIALGCTHYPFVRRKIQEFVGKSVFVADSGGAVARRLEYILAHENLRSDTKSEDLYYTTGDRKKFEEVVQKLLDKKITGEHIDLR